MYNKSNECCKYRDRISDQKKKKKTKKKKLIENENCEEVENCNQSRTKCLQKKGKKVVKVESSKFKSEMNDLLSRLKPSFPEREKYFNPHHVICFLEGMKKKDLKQQNIIYTIEGSKSYSGTMGKSRRMQKKPSQAVKCDSICSFDSVVDLAGLTLTREEMEEIAKNLKKQQKGQKKKKGGQENKVQELVEKKAPDVEEEKEEEKELQKEEEKEVEKEEGKEVEKEEKKEVEKEKEKEVEVTEEQ
ncbi:putative uncharacterized protein DDB_G0271982 [Belonocnema kinseyi]|uniref:putative uncharacterized protein DDB_G0271982 n=1 Tax=Belonocnema kinseyi TaxID=2817044 RepID=UPI00143D354F|nr:putative uncharacterized protein DDB_G0271982 [Belonocnema kinseyi]